MPNLKYIGKNILDNELEVRNGNIIGDHTEVIRVTVVSDGGNKYAFEERRHLISQLMRVKPIGLTNPIARTTVIRSDSV